MKLLSTLTAATLGLSAMIGTGVIGSVIPVARSVTASPDRHVQTRELDYAKYGMDRCVTGDLVHAAASMTGYLYDDETRPYSHCVANFDFYNWTCLCEAGDGEGSALMSEALVLSDYPTAWYPGYRCGGMDYEISMTISYPFFVDVFQPGSLSDLTRFTEEIFPQWQNFCRRIFNGEIYELDHTPRKGIHGRDLTHTTLPKPATSLVPAEEQQSGTSNQPTTVTAATDLVAATDKLPSTSNEHVAPAKHLPGGLPEQEDPAVPTTPRNNRLVSKERLLPQPQPKVDVVPATRLPLQQAHVLLPSDDLVASLPGGPSLDRTRIYKPKIPDFANLPEGTEDALILAAELLIMKMPKDGLVYYATCLIPSETGDWFDYPCLCRGGDGKGSALMDVLLLNLLVWVDFGWEYVFRKCCLRCFRIGNSFR